MIKLLSAVVLSLTILIPSTIQNFIPTNSIILHVQSSNYNQSTNLYTSSVMTENGDTYAIESFDNISNQWLDATINNYGEILSYEIML